MQSLWIGGEGDQRAPETAAASHPNYQNLNLWWYVMLLAVTVAVAEAFLSSRYLGTLREEI